MNRVLHEPGFVLHRYDFSESSVIVEAFTRQHGRIALIAKGAKKPSSNFRPILLPLQRLSLSWGGDAEVRTLKGAEWTGGSVMPSGASLWAGLYTNELLLKLLARDDPHPRLFDAYGACCRVLALGGAAADTTDLALRAFELLLLRELGVLSKLEQQTQWIQGQSAEVSSKPDADTRFALRAELGLSADADGLALSDWAALEAALGRFFEAAQADRPAEFAGLMRALAPHTRALKPQLRSLLNYHIGSPLLNTRQVMMEIGSL